MNTILFEDDGEELYLPPTTLYVGFDPNKDAAFWNREGVIRRIPIPVMLNAYDQSKGLKNRPLRWPSLKKVTVAVVYWDQCETVSLQAQRAVSLRANRCPLPPKQPPSRSTRGG